MLREDDIQIDQGRAAHGGDFLRLAHRPTGISRQHAGPLRNVNTRELIQHWLAEIESELQQRGLTEYIVPDYKSKNSRQQ